MKTPRSEVNRIASTIGVEGAALMAFIATESPMVGFQDGKILIQFEPVWFKRKEPFAPSGAWSMNNVDVQSKEWIAFNNAYRIDADSAMESTSIGLPQIMGFHWKRLGYKSVGAMWDHFKEGEIQQIEALARFIFTDKRLLAAIKLKDWHTVASIYNGSGYRALAIRLKRDPYDVVLDRNYELYSKIKMV